MSINRPRRLLCLVAVLGSLVAACASSGGEGWTFAPASATPAASPSASPSGSPGETNGASPSTSPGESPGSSPAGNTVAVEETAQLQILRDGQPLTELHVKAGETYTFEVTNTANFTHDFYIGSAQALQAGETDQLEGVPEFSSGTEQFEWTAPTDTSAQLEFACTVPGHYASMHGSIIIE
jgi:uncharacterized cupredoxin-like copper-binding protein